MTENSYSIFVLSRQNIIATGIIAASEEHLHGV